MPFYDTGKQDHPAKFEILQEAIPTSPEGTVIAKVPESTRIFDRQAAELPTSKKVQPQRAD